MKTNKNYSELSEGQLKAIALMQFNNEDFELVKDDEGDIYIYRLEDGERGDMVDPIEGDEERDNYIVLTDDEANEKAKEYILDTVWAFNADFLAGETGHDYEVFKAIQSNNRCESNNAAILALIEDEDAFVEAAISADGRGHFLNTYDGHENEETINGLTLYIYRMN